MDPLYYKVILAYYKPNITAVCEIVMNPHSLETLSMTFKLIEQVKFYFYSAFKTTTVDQCAEHA